MAWTPWSPLSMGLTLNLRCRVSSNLLHPKRAKGADGCLNSICKMTIRHQGSVGRLERYTSMISDLTISCQAKTPPVIWKTCQLDITWTRFYPEPPHTPAPLSPSKCRFSGNVFRRAERMRRMTLNSARATQPPKRKKVEGAWIDIMYIVS